MVCNREKGERRCCFICPEQKQILEVFCSGSRSVTWSSEKMSAVFITRRTPACLWKVPHPAVFAAAPIRPIAQRPKPTPIASVTKPAAHPA